MNGNGVGRKMNAIYVRHGREKNFLMTFTKKTL